MLKGIVDRFFAVAGAFIGSQIPVYMQQYTQRLSGHLAELSHWIQEMTKVAALSEKSLEQYIEKFIQSSDPDFSRQGELMQAVVQRWEDFSQTLHHLAEAPVYSKAFVFFSEIKYEIARHTVYQFQPGISLTLEGMAYALAGMAVACLCYRGCVKIINVMFRRLQYG